MAAFDLASFRSELSGDGARPNLFEVILPMPVFAALGGVYDATKKLTFMCRATQLPGDSIGFIQVP